MIAAHRRVVALLALACLLLVGCKTRAELVVKPDGSGTFTTIAEIENRLLEALGEEGDPFAQAERSAQDSPFPVETERYETADGRGIRASYSFSSIEELNERLASVDEEQRQSGLFQDGSIEVNDEGWHFEATGGAPGAEEQIPIDPDELAKLIDARFVVVLPGDEGENNADSTERVGEDSVRYEWVMTPGQSDVRLMAQSVLPPSLLERLAPFAAVLLVLLIIGGGVWIARKRSAAKT